MFNAMKFSRPSPRSAFMLHVFLFAAVLALLPISAGAQCSKWDASGKLFMIQRGAIASIGLDLIQRGRVITGTAYTAALANGGQKTVNGTVDGTFDGDSFSIQIFWPDDLTGVYTGKVLPSGRLEGETYDKNNSKNRQPWRSEGVLKCAPSKTLNEMFLGGQRPAKLSKSAPSKPSMKIPGIVAGPAAFPTQYERVGHVTLTWNAGPANPYAELWVKINRGPDLFVVKQPNGSRSVPVERNAHYIYIVKEAGRILAAVEFIAR